MDEARTCNQWNAVMDSKPHAVASGSPFNEATGLHLGNIPTNVRIPSGSNLNNHESTRIIVEFTPPRT